MPRYFFNLDGEAPDESGTVLPDTGAARVAAVTHAGELLKYAEDKFWRTPEWRLRVTDDQGAAVCALTVKGE